MNALSVWVGATFAAAIGPSVVYPLGPSCDLKAATEWIDGWFEAWELTSKEILHLSHAPAPAILFYDASCVYTTSAKASGTSDVLEGPALLETPLPWRALPHDGTITLPDSTEVPVQLMTFASPDGEGGSYFIMAAPDFWAAAGVDNEVLGRSRALTAVFLHEFAHTRQIPFFQDVIAPIGESWVFPEELSDDVVQERFGSDSAYVAAYQVERDLLFRAALADSISQVRALAAEALAMMRTRQARWFTGENEVFTLLDDAFLSLEGAGQWTGYAWLTHPNGGGVQADVAMEQMRGRKQSWTQDEGLALFLVLDRLLPNWPALVFGTRSAGAVQLLEQAVGER